MSLELDYELSPSEERAPLNLYRVQFVGRKRGAIGIFYQHSIVVEAESASEAESAIYDTHEHVSNVWTTNMGPVAS